MKKLKLLFVLFILINANHAFANSKNIGTSNFEKYQSSIITTPDDFEDTLLQAMMSLGDNNHIKVTKVSGGYIIKVIAGTNPVNRQLKCCGGGVSFAKCVKELLEIETEVTVSKCNKTCGTYCAYTGG